MPLSGLNLWNKTPPKSEGWRSRFRVPLVDAVLAQLEAGACWRAPQPLAVPRVGFQVGLHVACRSWDLNMGCHLVHQVLLPLLPCCKGLVWGSGNQLQQLNRTIPCPSAPMEIAFLLCCCLKEWFALMCFFWKQGLHAPLFFWILFTSDQSLAPRREYWTRTRALE